MHSKLANLPVRLIAALIALRRPHRRRLAFLGDGVLCFLAAWLGFAIRLGEWSNDVHAVLRFAVTAFVIWIPISLSLGLYSNLVRFSGAKAFADLCKGCAVLAFALFMAFALIQHPGVPRTMVVLHPILFFLLLLFARLSTRFIVVDLMHAARVPHTDRTRLLVYGAGQGGQQLANSLNREPHLFFVGYIDDDERLSGERIDGKTVWHSTLIDRVLDEREIDEIIIAIPSASRNRKREIVAGLQHKPVKVKLLPGIGQLIGGHVTINDLRDVQVEDLLGRDPVAADDLMMERSIADKVVMVTGAGGSIGSELCRQVIRSRPRELILVEQSEFALYQIEAELRALVAKERYSTQVIPELADLADYPSVRRIFGRRQPGSVYHAAAYKHVPLVEANPVAGLRNNIFSTFNCVMAAEEIGVGRFILISTDKAVRPTNVMGASKRVCELILQSRSHAASPTCFAMVRFGNVLGSSGSVVPLFKRQIAAGGPVTITHRDIIRYFMTIPEAAQLVIQAGAMAQGGEVFVLDMGQPVRIADLAESMIRLSGRTVRNAAHPHGDVEIVEVGLRPGEKLYEELLIGNDPRETAHPRIMLAHEEFLEWAELENSLETLERALEQGQALAALAVVRKIVPEYQREDLSMFFPREAAISISPS